MLAFDGEPLAEAVEEINRHNQRQIAIDDSALAARPVVGIFRASDTEGFAQTVATALGAQSMTDGEVIHLRPLPTP
jgi:transmembrane sensor